MDTAIVEVNKVEESIEENGQEEIRIGRKKKEEGEEIFILNVYCNYP